MSLGVHNRGDHSSIGELRTCYGIGGVVWRVNSIAGNAGKSYSQKGNDGHQFMGWLLKNNIYALMASAQMMFILFIISKKHQMYTVKSLFRTFQV